MDGIISHNTFDSCNFERCENGIVFECGASQNVITNSTFAVLNYGIKIQYGSGNVSSFNRFNTYGEEYVVSPITFPYSSNNSLGNVSSNDYMDSLPYSEYFPPLVTGDCDYSNSFIHSIMLDMLPDSGMLFRLPAVSGSRIMVDYSMQNSQCYRKGVLEIVPNHQFFEMLDTNDEYTFSGLVEISQVTLSVTVVQYPAQSKKMIEVWYNTDANISGVIMKYTYRIS